MGGWGQGPLLPSSPKLLGLLCSRRLVDLPGHPGRVLVLLGGGCLRLMGVLSHFVAQGAEHRPPAGGQGPLLHTQCSLSISGEKLTYLSFECNSKLYRHQFKCKRAVMEGFVIEYR